MLLWLFDIFQQPRKKETSMYAGLTQKASRAFPEFCFMELQIWVQSTDNQATASKKNRGVFHTAQLMEIADGYPAVQQLHMEPHWLKLPGRVTFDAWT